MEERQKIENERKKEYLWGYRKACKRLAVLEEQLVSIQQVEASAKTQQLSDMPKGGGHQADLSDLMVKIEKIQRKMDATKVEAMRVKVDIELKIAEMADPDEQMVLRMRYIEGKKWNYISEKMKYSWRQVINIHGRALLNVQIK